ncbi:RicAFT regulatory complex protein RicA family protein [Staphylococcus lutrae]|uniref:YlbF family regulator n=1 Tax=Staphylococcus lutrae TaxID=155085 RepID=A0AAC9RPQ6_9STAP|nr:YlbF family regulator [Staphylococcus lutrae]ARJ51743.1 hypothetical protein B5P37_10660 [Staphylococcus lutrae]PNZ34213.1 hypothetical protein CD134_11410 [Staphylococcus lutrae]
MNSRENILARARELSTSLQSLETIQAYQRVEAQIHQNQRISQYMAELKANQKQSVNLQNYDKPLAFEQSEAKIEALQKKMNHMPIVNEFKVAQQEANTLLQVVIGTLSSKIGQENFEVEDHKKM